MFVRSFMTLNLWILSFILFVPAFAYAQEKEAEQTGNETQKSEQKNESTQSKALDDVLNSLSKQEEDTKKDETGKSETEDKTGKPTDDKYKIEMDQGEQAAKPQTTDDILDDIIERNRVRKAEDVRDAILLGIEAKRLIGLDRKKDAEKLLKRATELDPENRENKSLLNEISNKNRPKPTSSSEMRALARISNGLSYSHELIDKGEFEHAADLLSGLLECKSLFADQDRFSFYEKLANEELSRIPNWEQLLASMKNDTNTGLSTVRAKLTLNASKYVDQIVWDLPQWFPTIASQIQSKISVNYLLEPLSKLVDDANRISNVKIILDPAIDSGTNRTQPINRERVNIRLDAVPLELILQAVCSQLQLEYILTEQAVVLTTVEKASEYFRSFDAINEDQQSWFAQNFGGVPYSEMFKTGSENPTVIQKPIQPEDPNADPIPEHLRSGKDLMEHVKSVLVKAKTDGN